MIKYLVIDVDGTLTDGKIYMGPQGELIKAFNVKDGYAIKELLPQHGITPVVITARQSDIVSHRCREIGISAIYQGIRDKIGCLQSLLQRSGASLSDVAYMGDDDLDLQCLLPIRQAGGLAGCPADASPRVTAACQFISSLKAGEGAVREFAEYLVSLNTENSAQSLQTRLDQALSYIDSLDFDSLDLGRHDVSPDFYFNVMQYQPADTETIPYEAHCQYIDIQRVFDGEEMLMIAPVYSARQLTPYDPARDLAHFSVPDNHTCLVMRRGSCAILFPRDARKAVRFGTQTSTVKKIVGKLRLPSQSVPPATHPQP